MGALIEDQPVQACKVNTSALPLALWAAQQPEAAGHGQEVSQTGTGPSSSLSPLLVSEP